MSNGVSYTNMPNKKWIKINACVDDGDIIGYDVEYSLFTTLLYVNFSP